MADDLWETAFGLVRKAARLRQKMRLQPVGVTADILRERIARLEEEALIIKARAAAFPSRPIIPKVKRNWPGKNR